VIVLDVRHYRYRRSQTQEHEVILVSLDYKCRPITGMGIRIQILRSATYDK
jgi:hypothetical protein